MAHHHHIRCHDAARARVMGITMGSRIVVVGIGMRLAICMVMGIDVDIRVSDVLLLLLQMRAATWS